MEGVPAHRAVCGILASCALACARSGTIPMVYPKGNWDLARVEKAKCAREQTQTVECNVRGLGEISE